MTNDNKTRHALAQALIFAAVWPVPAAERKEMTLAFLRCIRAVAA